MKKKIINCISKYVDADEDMLVIYKYGIDIIINKLVHIFLSALLDICIMYYLKQFFFWFFIPLCVSILEDFMLVRRLGVLFVLCLLHL